MILLLILIMPVLLKLIGCQNNYEILDKFHGELTINNVISILNTFNITTDDICHIKFLTDNYSQNNISIITDYTNIMNISINETYNIYIYSSNENIKNKLEFTFNLINNEENNIIEQPGTEPSNEHDINTHNKTTLELLNNDSFKNILKLYKNNSDIFTTFIQFITFDEDISFNNKSHDIDYDKLVNEILKLNLDIDKELILIKLKKYNGHLNLTLRDLISNL